MKIAFTICSNNYLAQAKTLGDSLIKCNLGYTFIIGLADELDPSINYAFFEPHPIITVADLAIPGFDSLWKKYDIIEFNTSIKASFFKFLFKKFSSAEFLFYFDPDIMIYNALTELEAEFSTNEILLTPHILTPVKMDAQFPGENLFLKYGIYNLGFIGVKQSKGSENKFLNWWEDRSLTLGFNDLSKGLFVDQLWINLAPVFFEKVKILKNLGLNVAPWNLHERTILNENENGLLMNDRSKMIFFHFSSYNFRQPNQMSKNYGAYTFKTHPELIELYQEYNQALTENKVSELSIVPCSYILQKEIFLEKLPSQNKRKSRLKQITKQFIPPVFLKIKNHKRSDSDA